MRTHDITHKNSIPEISSAVQDRASVLKEGKVPYTLQLQGWGGHLNWTTK